MKNYIGKYLGKETSYLDNEEGYLSLLPKSNWHCLLIANEDFNKEKINEFALKAFTQDILGIRSQGKYGNMLDACISILRTDLELDKINNDIDVSIYGDGQSALIDAFWECFGAPALPNRTNWDSLILVCISFDSRSYENELRRFLKMFNDGWLPNS